MDLIKVIAKLHEQRRALDEAIHVLTRLAAGAGKRRGRPPKWMAEAAQPKHRGRPPKNPAADATATATPQRGRKAMSKAARKAQSERMKKYWAAKRKAES